jgi:HPt (histidine-containing phosphotransfer) domain-containing protein
MEEPNLNYIKQLSGGDETFEDKLISVIQLEFPEEKYVYLKNITAKNYKESAENVHKLKHKISILGLEKSYEVAAKYEENLKENSSVLKEEFDSILEVITQYLTTL